MPAPCWARSASAPTTAAVFATLKSSDTSETYRRAVGSMHRVACADLCKGRTACIARCVTHHTPLTTLESEPKRPAREQRRYAASPSHGAQSQLTTTGHCTVRCGTVQQHTAVALVCSRLNMEMRRALATLRHLIRQTSNVLWHVCGTELHQNHAVSFMKDTMELFNIHNRPWTRLPVTATFLYPLPHLTCALLYTAIKSPTNA